MVETAGSDALDSHLLSGKKSSPILRRFFRRTETDRALQRQTTEFRAWRRIDRNQRNKCVLHFASEFNHSFLLESAIRERDPGDWLDELDSDGKGHLEIAVAKK
jgi:hypothetical protein